MAIEAMLFEQISRKVIDCIARMILRIVICRRGEIKRKHEQLLGASNVRRSHDSFERSSAGPPSRQMLSSRWDPAIETVSEGQRDSVPRGSDISKRFEIQDNQWPASPVIESGYLAAIPVVPVRLWRHRRTAQ